MSSFRSSGMEKLIRNYLVKDNFFPIIKKLYIEIQKDGFGILPKPSFIVCNFL